MPGRLFLSPVPISGGTLRRPSPGRWYAARDFLTQYSTDILVEGTVEYRQIVRGVPSVFAQPIYFAHALGNMAHPAHAAAKSQWRGLLACFALERWLNLPLLVEAFAIAGTPTASRVNPDAVFWSVLRSQIPEPIADWQDLFLVRCDGQLVGATSPLTLVYPPAESDVPTRIPWQRGGVLIDPIEHFDERGTRSSSTELRLLATWVDRILAGRASRWGAPASGPWDRSILLIANALEAWKADLGRYQRMTERTLDDSKATPAAGLAAPYAAFFRSLGADGLKPESNLTIRCSSDREVIILKRSGLEPKQRVYASILVEQVDLARVPSEGMLREATQAATADVPFVIAEELFLTPKLLELPVAEGAHSLGDGRFPLPLRADFLRYFSVDDIKNGNVVLELRESESAWVVRLTIKLENGTPFWVERTYDKTSDVVRLKNTDVPAFAIWPDFVCDEWEHSLALYVGGEEPHRVIAAPINRAGNALALNPKLSNRGRRFWTVWRSSVCLQGFALSDSQANGAAADLGLLLRKDGAPPPPANPDTRWRVAVDFGTSNTQLACSAAVGDAARPLGFENRTILLSRPFDAFGLEAHRAYFPSMDSISSPFPSVLFKNQGWPATDEPGEAKGDVHSPRFTLTPGERLCNAIRDLKWGARGASGGDRPTRTFLSLLSLGIAAEARSAGASRVDLHWSYPHSLPDPSKQAMRSFWQSVPGTFAKSGVTVAIAEEGGRSESEAMSRFFASLPGQLPVRSDGLSIAVDIGGGSSDVGFWSNGIFLDQFSFKLAGNDLLVPSALDVPGFLESLLGVCSGSSAPRAGGIDAVRERPEIQLNALLVSSGERVPQAIHGVLAAAEPPWSTVRSAIYIFFAGVVFYLGVHSRRHVQKIGRNNFAILFGGKAASLLQWLSNDAKTLDKVLKEMFLSGLAFDDPNLSKSSVELFGPGLGKSAGARSLKSEVANGLLLAKLPGEPPDGIVSTVVGELGWKMPNQDRDALPWDHEVTLERLAELKAPDNLGSGFAPYFVSTLVPKHAAELGLDKVRLGELRLTVMDVENTVRTLAIGQGVLQPIFACELRRLIESYLQRVKEG